MDSTKNPFHFRPLDMEAIEEEIATLRSVEKELEEEWKTESLKYEETITVPHCSHPVARRNYFNPDKVVQDVSLFPYHDVYYPLIDAYDCLYSKDGDHPIVNTALRPRKDQNPYRRSICCRIEPAENDMIDHHFEYVSRCYFTSATLYAAGSDVPYQRDSLYTSPDSVVNCILLEDETVMLPSDQWIPGEAPSLLYDGQHEFWSQMTQMFVHGLTLEEVNINLPTCFELPRDEKVQILLRLLRHALSEYQRDYYLALSILTRLSLERALDDVAVLRKLLLIVNSECVECENFCNDEDGMKELEHDCGEWSAFLNGLHFAIGYGISNVTEEHAVTLAAFVRSRYLHEFGHMLVQSEPPEKQRRSRLKRAIAAFRTEEGPVTLRIQLIEILTRSLGSRASLERKRCREVITRRASPDNTLGTFICSYWSCIRALVDIGNATVEIIPDSEPYFTLGSEVVKNIAYGFMDRVSPPSNRVRDIAYHDDDTTYLIPVQNDTYPNVIDSRRYLNLLLRKRELPSFVEGHKEYGGIDSIMVSDILETERPAKVLDTVRSLFVREMVDIRLSRMGYGDFVVWCGFELNMDDPVMFWSEYQYPVEEDEDSQESEDSDDDDPWVHDESDNSLSPTQLRARYDFSLLVTLRALQAPWTPLMHHTFPRAFCFGIKELLLCTRRLGIPNEVGLRMLPYVDRRWWQDQPQCWSYTCQLDKITKDVVRRKQNEVAVPNGIVKPLLACSACRTAVYCSKKCLKDDLKAGHRRLCCLPPFKRSRDEETALFRDVFKNDIPEMLLYNDNLESGEVNNVAKADEVENTKTAENGGIVDDGDDDDGSWESWDSNGNGESSTLPLNLTDTISQYFSKS